MRKKKKNIRFGGVEPWETAHERSKESGPGPVETAVPPKARGRGGEASVKSFVAKGSVRHEWRKAARPFG